MLVLARTSWLINGVVTAFREICYAKVIAASPNIAVRSSRSNERPLCMSFGFGDSLVIMV
jgi:hypothetical protein